ncbi:hypothetical protein B9Z55_007578 [Caenorhabditis nigoni]|nr:hypothetical protein B9Z55_007578 [Caenorhabditis nigoni]
MCPPISFGVATQYFFQADMMFSMPPPHYAPMPLAVPMEQYGYGYYPEPQPSGSYSEQNKENEVPSSYKTRLCKLFNSGKSTICPHGANCRFAHGVEELRSYGTVPDHQVQSKSYKTILCRNYAPGGSGDCPYRLACRHARVQGAKGTAPGRNPAVTCSKDGGSTQPAVPIGSHDQLQGQAIQHRPSEWKGLPRIAWDDDNGDDQLRAGYRQADEEDRRDQGMAVSRERDPFGKWIRSNEDPLDE